MLSFRAPSIPTPGQEPPPQPLLLTLGLTWAALGWLAVAVVHAGGLSWDAPGLQFWHRHATPALNKLAVLLTIIGNTWPMVGTGLLVVLVLWWRRQERAA